MFKGRKVVLFTPLTFNPSAPDLEKVVEELKIDIVNFGLIDEPNLFKIPPTHEKLLVLIPKYLDHFRAFYFHALSGKRALIIDSHTELLDKPEPYSNVTWLEYIFGSFCAPLCQDGYHIDVALSSKRTQFLETAYVPDKKTLDNVHYFGIDEPVQINLSLSPDIVGRDSWVQQKVDCPKLPLSNLLYDHVSIDEDTFQGFKEKDYGSTLSVASPHFISLLQKYGNAPIISVAGVFDDPHVAKTILQNLPIV
jgi:hypothetical protein